MKTRAKVIAVWLIAGCVTAGVAFVAVDLGLLMAIVAGLLLGLALRHMFRKTQEALADDQQAPLTVRARRWVGGLLIVIGTAVVPVGLLLPFLLFAPMQMRAPPPPPGVYTARLALDSDHWLVDERWVYAPNGYRTLFDPEARSGPAGGWEEQIVGDSVVLGRERVIPVQEPKFRLRSAWVFPIPWVTGTPSKDSRIVFDLPRFYSIATYPPAESHVSLLDEEGRERMVINPWQAGGDGTEVRIQVLNPLLRHRAGAWIVGVSLFDPVKWILLLLAAVFSDEIKNSFVRPPVKKVLTVLGVGKDPDPS